MPNYSGEYALSSFTTIGHLHHFCLLPIIIYEKSIHLQIIPMLKSLQWILAKDTLHDMHDNTSFSTYQPYKPPFSSIKCPVFRPIFWRLERVMCSTRMSWLPSCSGIETESGPKPGGFTIKKTWRSSKCREFMEIIWLVVWNMLYDFPFS